MSTPRGFGGDCGSTEMMKCIPLVEVIWWTKSPWFQTYPRGVEVTVHPVIIIKINWFQTYPRGVEVRKNTSARWDW